MTESTLRIIVPIITFVLGALFSIVTSYFERKRVVRSFPHVEESYLALDLSNNILKEHSKLYLTEGYTELMDREEINKKAEGIFEQITNLGPGHMVNCDISIEVSSTDYKKKWPFKVFVPLIKKDETVMIPLSTYDMSNIRIIVSNVEINFQTHNKEKMYYKQKLKMINEKNTVIRETLHLKKWFVKRELYKYEGKNSLFMYITPYKG